MCPLTALSVSQSLLCAVFMADLSFTLGVEFARKLHAVFLADPTFLVSVESFIVSWTQSSWLMRLSYSWWHAHLSGRCRYLMYRNDEHSDTVAVQSVTFFNFR